MTTDIKCPACQSTNWRCWDQVNEVFTNDQNPEEWDMLPVGRLVCKDCWKNWTNRNWYGWTWQGRDTHEAFGWDE